MCNETKSANPTTVFSKKAIEEEIIKATRTDVAAKLKEHVEKVVCEISKIIHDTALEDATGASVSSKLFFTIEICRKIPSVLKVRRNNSGENEEIPLKEAGKSLEYNEVYNADFCEALKKALTDGTHGFSLKDGCSHTYEASYDLRKLVGLAI